MSICIIPARANSKRIKNKNIKKINNVPLIGIVIKIAKKSKLFKRIIVTTDSKKIAKIAISYGAEAPFLRSKKISHDYSLVYKALIDVIKKLKINEKFIFCIYPTAVFTKIVDLKKAFKILKKNKADMVCPVTKLDNKVLRAFTFNSRKFIKYLIPKYGFYRSQDLPNIFLDTGSFYIYKRNALLRSNKKNIIPKKTINYLVKNQTVDINDSKDLKLAIKIFKRNKN